MRVALVHDWLLQPGGAERVLASFRALWPDAPIYTLLCDRRALPSDLADADIRTSFLDRMGWTRRHHRKLLALMPSAIESFDLSKFDVIVSSSHCVAKGVLTRKNQVHVCYCHTPVRYAWDMQEEYLESAGLSRGMRGMAARAVLSRIRVWDVVSAPRVTQFVANSSFIADRIQSSYGRDSTVIHPPVDVDEWSLQRDTPRGDTFVVASRLVGYKRIDLLVKAFNQLKRPLIVFGTGPDAAKLAALAGPTVEMRGWRPVEEVRAAVAGARAFLTAAKEDFGIATAEALAAGTPVIGFGACGTSDIVEDGRDGVLFDEQSVDAIVAAVRRSDTLELDATEVSRRAERFNAVRFRDQIAAEVGRVLSESGGSHLSVAK